MTPRRLLISDSARQDLRRRIRYLTEQRDADFAVGWAFGLMRWLDRVALGGAQIGTEFPGAAGFRTFGYKRQATVLAEFRQAELIVLRVYFRGQAVKTR